MLDVIEIETALNPRATIFVMHGLGANGNDFVPIAQEWDLSAIGPVRFVFPHAPHIPVSLNNGYVMPAWYDIAHDRSREDEAGLRKSQAAVEELIQREKQRGIASNRIVIAGFSQGCAMSLMVGLRHAEPLAGILGMSGYLPLATLTAAERSEANANTRIFLAHGRQDPMIALDRAVASRDALRALGYGVEWHEYDMPHTVCMEEVADMNRWLLEVLKD